MTTDEGGTDRLTVPITRMRKSERKTLERRMRVLAVIRQHILRHVTPPSTREIDRAVNGHAVSNGTARMDTLWLIEHGYLVKTGPDASHFTVPEVQRAVQDLAGAGAGGSEVTA